jgi:hypothetical protein
MIDPAHTCHALQIDMNFFNYIILAKINISFGQNDQHSNHLMSPEFADLRNRSHTIQKFRLTCINIESPLHTNFFIRV